MILASVCHPRESGGPERDSLAMTEASVIESLIG